MQKVDSVKSIKGVGDKSSRLLEKLNIFTVEDLIGYYPRDYDTYLPPISIRDFRQNGRGAIQGVIIKSLAVSVVRNLKIVTGLIRDNNGDTIDVTWYNMTFLQKKLKPGMHFIFRGNLSYRNKVTIIEQPEVFTLGNYENLLDVKQPVYSLTAGITRNFIAKSVKIALENVEDLTDNLAKSIRKEYNLMDYREAVWNIHFPAKKEVLEKARRRLIFEEFFNFIVGVQNLRGEIEKTANHFDITPKNQVRTLIEKLPFKLTGAQFRTFKEIEADLSGNHIMNRMIQGDVGSGKTIVAVLSLYLVVLCGYQGAMMAPTEVLATQHYESIVKLCEDNNIADIKPVLLTGSMTAKQKRIVYQKIESHEANVIIGTHAVIQEKVIFSKLALVITDEQHRFGVRQRELLEEKGTTPHVLVMSATPIPRSLAIIIYGDLDISIIDELPSNRLPIKNCVVNTSYREKAYDFIKKEIYSGRQAYVICPMVWASEIMDGENVIDYTDKLRSNLPSDIRVEFLHGKMKNQVKNQIMEQFAQNEIQVLVSTTVIEVGIDVPNATVMMVENAERFGLAQLHQLRGRVGRGKYQSYCIFINGNQNKKENERLEILNKSNDGFFIASEDLKLRGPGDFFGVRQSGLLEFKLGDIYSDSIILKEASKAAKKYGKNSSVIEDFVWSV